VYRLQLMNTGERSHLFRIEVNGIRTATVVDEDVVELDGASARAVPVRVRVAHGVAPTGSNALAFTVTAEDDPALRVTEKAVFIVPR
jgi:hypothetical protein